MAQKSNPTPAPISGLNLSLLVLFALWLLAALVLFVLHGRVPGPLWQQILAQAVAIGLLAAPTVYLLAIRPLIRLHGAPSTAAAEPPAALATIDSLTHTLNQRGLTTSLLEAMAQAQRYNTPLALAVLRVEQLADAGAPGTPARDRMIQFAASVIGEVVRMPDRVGRNPNDDFLIIMPQTKIPAATKVAERISAAMTANPMPDNEGKLRVRFGVAAYGKGEDLETFLANAGRAVDEPKKRPKAG